MLAPHELKNKEFNKSLRGYSTEEVDEHIDFLIEKYTELYRANDELEKQLRLTQAQLDAMKSDEEAIRSALINAQKASNRIIGEANERADVIMSSARNSCDKMIDDAKASVRAENEKLRLVREQISSFKRQLYDKYQKHIELIEKITPDSDLEIRHISEDDEAEFSKKVVERIKNDLTGKDTIISGTAVPFAEEDVSADKVENEIPYVRVSAEENIPDEITEKVEKQEAIRDSLEFADDPVSDRETEETDEIMNGKDVYYCEAPVVSPANIPESGGDASADDELKIEIERTDISSDDEYSPVSDDETGGSIINAIKQINFEVSNSSSVGNDDEELLRIINSLSRDSGNSSTAEFNKAYDEKKI